MKLFQFNKSLGYIVATVVCLLFLCACYFFIYLPANQRMVEEQRFRTLQNVDGNIHDKIENSISLLNNLISADNPGNMPAYADKIPKDKFILSIAPRDASNHQVWKKQDSLVNIIVYDSTSQVTIELQKYSSNLKGSLTFTFKQFIEYLLPDAVFDQYIIFSKGKTVYESYPSGITVVQKDSLYNTKSGVSGPCMKDINSGGNEYKLFLHPVNFGGNTSWIIGGILSNRRYYNERSQLPAGIMMLMMIILLAMIVIFPWIKLYHMGGKDRLTVIDGISIMLVSMILISLVTNCFFRYNRSFRVFSSPDSKKILAAQITNAFYDETKKLYRVLDYYDKLRLDKRLDANIVNLNNNNTAYENSLRHASLSSFRDSINRYKDSLDIKQVYWLNDNGQEQFNWTTDIQNAPHSNFKARNYFKNIKENKSYYLDGESEKKFYLDQVVSWTSGSFTSVISRPSSCPGSLVAATTFTMQSVDSTILPVGYSFAIVDDNGKVLYHSIKSKNLNENLKSEFSDSASITSCINSRVEGVFITRYYSKTYSVFITPIKNLPYSIIIFSDKSFQETRDIETYSFTFSMITLLFLYIVIQLGVTFIVSSRNSFFKKQSLATGWIAPKDNRRYEYLLSAALNGMMIGILLWNFPGRTFFEFLFMILFAIIYVSLFYNLILARRYSIKGKINNFRYKIKAISWLITLLVIHMSIASCLLEEKSLNILIFTELFSVVTGCIIILLSNGIRDKVRHKLSDKIKYTHTFSLMVLTVIIITSGIPVVFFYISSYNYEQKLGIRYRQTDYANRLLAQPNFNINIRHLYKDTIFHYGSLTHSSKVDSISYYNKTGMYFDSSYIGGLPAIINSAQILKNQELTIEKERSLHILGLFRLLLSDKAVKTNKLSFNGSVDSSVLYHPGFFDVQKDSGVYTYRATGIKDQYMMFRSYKLHYNMPSMGEHFFTFWIWLLVLLVFFYLVILNILKKLFCLNLPDLQSWKELDEKIIKDNKLNKLLFIIGLPGSGKKKIVEDWIISKDIKCPQNNDLIYNENDAEKSNVLVADLINIPTTGPEIVNDKTWIRYKRQILDTKYKLIIFNHFEYNIQDEFTNLTKLDLLEELTLKNTAKIIILSTVHPVNFLDSLNEHIKKDEAALKSGHDLERWHVLLGHYRLAILPILQPGIQNREQGNQLLRSETAYSNFLHDMQDVTLHVRYPGDEKKITVEKKLVVDNDIKNELKLFKENESDLIIDQLALKLQTTSHYFYMYIWQSLTKEEKFLLYDLAEDNLVNSYDSYNLAMLVAKGVIVNTNGPLQLFNRGFRNFILTAIGNTEAMKIKDRIRENGNWGNLKTPFLIVIVTILAFLLISQEEAFSRLIAYVAALSAAVPVILRIVSVFDRGSSKAKA